MTALLCTALLSALMLLEVADRPAGSVGAGLLLTLLLACALGPVCALLGGLLRTRRWAGSLLSAAPCMLAWNALDTALRRALEVDHGIVAAAAWAAALPLGLAAAAAVWLGLRRVDALGTGIRGALALAAAVAATLAALMIMHPHMSALAIFVTYGYLLAGFASYATRMRRFTMMPGALLFGLAAAFGPARYVELSAIFACTCALTTGCAVHVLGLRPTRLKPATLLSLCSLAFVLAHGVAREVPAAYSAARGSGALSGFVHAGHVASDVDGDGFGALFAQRDCAPFDRRVAPHRHEQLDNGIDDNCVLGDAGQASTAWVRAQEALQVPPPAIDGDLIVVMIDALRYDVAHSSHMPTLQRWASQGVDFHRAYSTSTFTASALGGILAARNAAAIDLRFFSRLSARPRHPPGGLAPWLRKRGYGTALAGRLRKTPLYYDDAYAAGFSVSEYTTQRDDAQVVARAAVTAWQRLDADRPRFMFVHHMQVHRLAMLRPQYEANAAAVDESLAWLRERIGGNATWVVLSDHGEEFGEHGGNFHASTLYEEVVHVPLIVLGPGLLPARVDAVTPIRSLMPTVMAALGAAPAPKARGPYLCLHGDDCRDLPVPMALELPDRHLHGLIVGNRKIIRDLDRQHVEAFDLAADPQELTPLDPLPRDLLDALRRWEEASMDIDDHTSTWPYLKSTPW